MRRWLVALCALFAADAHAESVRVVSDTPIDSLSASGPAPRASLDGPLPAGESFHLDVPVREGLEITATLELWPRGERGCAERMPESGPQRQTVGMAVTTSSTGDRVLRGRVSPLQVQQAYCLRIAPRMTLSGDTLEAFAAVMADEVVQAVSRGGARCPEVEDPELARAAFNAALEAARLGEAPPDDSEGVVRAAVLAVTRSGGLSACNAVREQRVRFEQAQLGLVAVEEARARSDASLRALPDLPAPPSPLVLVQGRLIAIGALLRESPDDEALQLAVDQLRRCDLKVGASCVAWANEVQALIGQSGGERERAMDRLERVSVSAPPELALYVDGGLRSLTALRSGSVAFDAEALAQQVEQLAAKGADGGAGQRWITTLRERARVDAALARVKGEQDGARSKLLAAQDALRQLWIDAVRSEAVRQRLVVGLGDIGLRLITSSGDTEGGVNYVTPVGGAAVAFPVSDDARVAWAAPYLGVNIYSLPAERVIPLSELAGHQVRQRVSLTVGALVDPNGPPLQAYSTQPAFRNAYPIVAGNVRVMRHIGLTGGAVWVRLEDPNPASAATSLVAYPFVGATLDVDVIHLLTDTLQGG